MCPGAAGKGAGFDSPARPPYLGGMTGDRDDICEDASTDPAGDADARPAAPAHGGEVLFDAVITPHRSLSPRGFAILMLAIGGVSFATGVAFVAMGAWPVCGFFGLDVALIYWAFRLNYRAARAVEHVLLTRDALTIRRLDHRGRGIEITMQPYWLRVEVAGEEMAEEIRLTSHGEMYTVGAWLSPAERAAFADALGDALRILREPPHLAEARTPGPAAHGA